MNRTKVARLKGDALFDLVQFDPRRYEADLRKPAAAKKYCIYFTPRSGSSWLTDILESTGRFGRPRELFNPNFVPRIASAVNARNLDQYIEMLRRKFSSNGVFGFQTTWYQLKTVFGDPAKFVKRFGKCPSFWLIRENIVLQAVSLSKMKQTGLTHASLVTPDGIRISDERFAYDADDIKRWLRHIANAELRTEKMFETFGINPVRMEYTRMTNLSPPDVINLIARNIGELPIDASSVDSRHSKIGTEKNQGFADRFRSEHASYVAEVEGARAEILQAVSRAQAATG